MESSVSDATGQKQSAGSVPWLKRHLFEPVLAPILKRRSISFLIVGFGALQVVLLALDLPGWMCPIKTVTGIPCPGCGLSSATLLLLRGNWVQALQIHAFAPVFLLGLAVIVIVSVLPGHLHQPVVVGIEKLERRTGIVAFLLLGLVLYWCLRLLYVW